MMVAEAGRAIVWSIVAVFAVLCVGCPAPLSLCVTVPNKQAGSPVIEVAEGRDCRKPALVTGMIVRRISDGKVLWTIGSRDGVKLNAIRYGEAPPGLDEGMAALPLKPGDHVNISVDGRGASGGVDVMIAP